MKSLSSIKTLTAIAFSMGLSSLAMAQDGIATYLVMTLQNGSATSGMPPQLEASLGQLKKSTKNPGEIIIKYERVQRFKQQSACGRVGFYPYQPATNTSWKQFGGELNICLDGRPPLQQCGQTTKLVAPNTACPDGSHPHATKEVQSAIDDAKKRSQHTL